MRWVGEGINSYAVSCMVLMLITYRIERITTSMDGISFHTFHNLHLSCTTLRFSCLWLVRQGSLSPFHHLFSILHPYQQICTRKTEVLRSSSLVKAWKFFFSETDLYLSKSQKWTKYFLTLAHVRTMAGCVHPIPSRACQNEHHDKLQQFAMAV